MKHAEKTHRHANIEFAVDPALLELAFPGMLSFTDDYEAFLIIGRIPGGVEIGREITDLDGDGLIVIPSGVSDLDVTIPISKYMYGDVLTHFIRRQPFRELAWAAVNGDGHAVVDLERAVDRLPVGSPAEVAIAAGLQPMIVSPMAFDDALEDLEERGFDGVRMFWRAARWQMTGDPLRDTIDLGRFDVRDRRDQVGLSTALSGKIGRTMAGCTADRDRLRIIHGSIEIVGCK